MPTASSLAHNHIFQRSHSGQDEHGTRREIVAEAELWDFGTVLHAPITSTNISQNLCLPNMNPVGPLVGDSVSARRTTRRTHTPSTEHNMSGSELASRNDRAEPCT